MISRRATLSLMAMTPAAAVSAKVFGKQLPIVGTDAPPVDWDAMADEIRRAALFGNPGHVPSEFQGFAQTVVSETWYMDDGKITHFPVTAGEWFK